MARPPSILQPSAPHTSHNCGSRIGTLVASRVYNDGIVLGSYNGITVASGRRTKSCGRISGGRVWSIHGFESICTGLLAFKMVVLPRNHTNCVQNARNPRPALQQSTTSMSVSSESPVPTNTVPTRSIPMRTALKSVCYSLQFPLLSIILIDIAQSSISPTVQPPAPHPSFGLLSSRVRSVLISQLHQNAQTT